MSFVLCPPGESPQMQAQLEEILLQTQVELENTKNWGRRYTEELNQLQQDDLKLQEVFSRIKAKNTALKETRSDVKAELEETRAKLKRTREVLSNLRGEVQEKERELERMLPESQELERDVSVLLKEVTSLRRTVDPMIKLRKEKEIAFNAAWGKTTREQEKTAAYEDNSMEVLGHSDSLDLAMLLVADQNE